jgi:hypothetical protein
VTDLLAIFTVVYEVFSAAFTTIRSYQALEVRASGGMHKQREGLTYLVLEQGMHVDLKRERAMLINVRTSLFLVSLWTSLVGDRQ